MARSLVWLIDVEPDNRGDVGQDPWEGSRLALPRLEHWRERWQQETGLPVQLNWFPRFDPQIETTFGRTAWLHQHCGGLLETIARQADLAGVHIHFWRWDERRRRWFNEFLDEPWLQQCIGQSVTGFQEAFGERPIAARFGDRWWSPSAAEAVRAAGILYDLSLEPGQPSRPLTDDRYATAMLPDMRNTARQPHVVETRAGTLWCLPLTMSPGDYWLPQRSFPFLRRATRPFNLVLHPRTLWRQFCDELERQTEEPLVFVVRSGDLRKPAGLDAFEFVLERVTRHPAWRLSRFLRVDTAMERYRQSLEAAARTP